MRSTIQEVADYAHEELEVVQVTNPQNNCYVVFYVSDNPFADWNRFPKVLESCKVLYPRKRFELRHIKDVDGSFVTRKQFHARKRSR